MKRKHVFAIIWKLAIITLLPEVDVPKAHSDYQSTNITPVIARAF